MAFRPLRRLFLTLTLVSCASSADVSIHWTGTMQAAGVTAPISLCLVGTADDGSIRIGDMRDAARIENVTVSLDRLSFVTYDGRNRMVTFELKHSTEAMTGEAVVDGRPWHVVLSLAPEPFPGSRSHTAAALRYSVKPTYTDEARAALFEGSVRLSVEVDANGVPHNIRVKRAVGLGLDEKAVQCVRQWRFKPALNGDTPVASAATVEVNFRL